MGRPKGSKNRANEDFKSVVTAVIAGEDLRKLLAQVPPERRLDVICKLAEFAFPKLARSEVSGEGGGPITVVIKQESDER